MQKFKRAGLLAGAGLALMAGFAWAGDNSTLVMASEPMTEKFSAFYSQTVPDRNVADYTTISCLGTDRLGAIVFNGIEGETRSFNGTDYTYKTPSDVKVKYDKDSDITTYTVKLREGMKFSDGKPITIDDLIFSYYVFLDPSYVGSTTLSTYDIIGLRDYQTQTSSAVYEKYAKFADMIQEKGKDVKPADGLTQEMIDAYNKLYDQEWAKMDATIVDYVMANYKDKAKDMGLDPAKIGDKEKYTLALMAWNLAKYDEKTGVLSVADTDFSFDVKNGKFATEKDFNGVTKAIYKNDLGKYSETEHPDQTNVLPNVKTAFVKELGPKDKEMAGKGVPNIEGIKRLDDYTVEVKMRGYSAPAIYQIGTYLAPKHYYGDGKYDYSKNYFGHPFGDLKVVASKTTKPTVASGPFKFVKYENRVAYLDANEHYWRGAPKIKHLQVKETQNSEVPDAIKAGTIDAGELSATKVNLETVKKFNSNGKLQGDVAYVTLVDLLGYGYIGMNSDIVNVGGSEHKNSDESKALRRGFATLIACYRGIVYDSYYGEAASVIEYPISNTSWAAPQPTDSGYHIAFSTDPEGKEIYTDGQSFEEREAAALKCATEWFKKAGYTWDDKAGKFTAAPKGAQMTYEITIGGQGKGDHPSFAVLTHAKAALNKIGLDLKINDPSDGSVMWHALEAHKLPMWCAAWASTVDPDMYQVYHSDNIPGRGKGTSNHYGLEDPQLDKLIIDARKSDDQAYRKNLYKQALDIIADWAVEIPCYQRKDGAIYSAQRINVDTLQKDVTTYWGAMAYIEQVEMR